jgi:2-dehydropantoate 2-reductase
MGVRLARAGLDVSVLARGATLAAIRSAGLRLVMNGETLSIPVVASDSPADLGQRDLVVIALKGNALAAVAPSLWPLLGPDTAVLSAMNGIPWWFFHGLRSKQVDRALQTVDPDGAITAAISPSRVIGCVVHSACMTSAPGCSVHKTGNGLIFGDPSTDTSMRLTRAVDAFRKAGFDVTISSRIHRDIWYKLWGNMTMNPISALTGATTDRMLDDPLVTGYVLRVMAEAAQIGRRIGCPIEQSGQERTLITRKLGAFKTSMLQDAEAGRPLEIDALLSAPREIARAVGVETPNLDALHGLIRLYASTRHMQ